MHCATNVWFKKGYNNDIRTKVVSEWDRFNETGVKHVRDQIGNQICSQAVIDAVSKDSLQLNGPMFIQAQLKCSGLMIPRRAREAFCTGLANGGTLLAYVRLQGQVYRLPRDTEASPELSDRCGW
ncbi:hypothetical protein DFH09DRAFT_1080497 [Mycena vulgaris]|nr:hypothetical protein DFH09DRAFT_1080497 [Mycena vulgaris]